MNSHGTVSSKSCCVEPLESRFLCSDVYVGRPELLGPPSFPSTGPPPVLNAGGIDRIGEDGSKTTVVTNLHRPCGMAVDPAGNLYYVDLADSAGGATTRATLFRRSPAGDTADLGVVFDSGGGTVGIGGWAIDVVAGPSGVYVNRPEVRSSDDPDLVLSPGSIDHVDPDGTRTTVVGGFRHPSAAAPAPDGSLYFVDVDYAPFRATLFRRSPDGVVRQVAPVVQTDSTTAVSTGAWAFDPVVGPGGDVFVNHPEVRTPGLAPTVVSPGGIDRFGPTGKRRVAVRGLREPGGLAFDAAGNFYYQDIITGPVRSDLFRRAGGRGRPVSLGIVADTTGGFISAGYWAFNTAVDSHTDVSASGLTLSGGRKGKSASAGAPGAARLLLADRGPSPLSGSATADLFFSTDAVLDGADVAAGSSSLAVRLKPGRSRAARLRFVYPTLAAGDYFVIARVRLNGAGDADPSDDTATTAAPVRVG